MNFATSSIIHSPVGVDTTGEWIMLDVAKFNQFEKSLTPSKKALDNRVVILLEFDQWIWLNICPQKKPPVVYAKNSGFISIFTDVNIFVQNNSFINHVSEIDEGKIHINDHKTQCGKVAKIIRKIAVKNKWEQVNIKCLARPYHTQLFVSKGNDIGTDILSLRDALYFSTMHIVTDILDIKSDRERFEIDYPWIEIKSSNPINATISDVVSELKTRELEVRHMAIKVAKASGLDGKVDILPHGQLVHKSNNFSLPLMESYAGSFHVWITLPYKLGSKFDHDKFINDHRNAVHALQWLEPMILACMPPDPRSPGSSQRYSRASMRSRLNFLSGFGVSEIKSPVNHQVMYYDSLDALNAGERPKIKMTDTVWLTAKDGMRLNLLACQEIDRFTLKRIDWSSGIGFNKLPNRGNDIRFDMCFECLPPKLMPLDIAFINTKKGLHVAIRDKNSSKYVLSEMCLNVDPKGLEFRVFDHIPGEHATKLLSIVVLACAAGQTAKNVKTAFQESSWMMQMRDCATYGSRTPINKEYFKHTCSALNIQVPNKHPRHAYEAFNTILEIMHRNHVKSDIAKRFGYSQKVVFPDINYQVWSTAVEKRTKTDLVLRNNIQKVGKNGPITEKSVEKYLGKEWRDDTYLLQEFLSEG